jgi:integrase
MARNKLTATSVASKDKLGKHGDGDGLYLYVSKTGNKSWVFVYIRNKKRREMGLGALGGTGGVSLARARIKAAEVRDILARGGDPFTELAERQPTVQRPTFGECAEAMLEGMAGSWRNPKHRAQWYMTLSVERDEVTGKFRDTGYCLSIRDRPVDEPDTPEVVGLLEPIWLDKHETATRVRGRVERVFDYAKAKRFRSGDNPARWKGHIQIHLPKPAADQRMKRGHHAALPYAVAPAFMARLRALTGMGALALQFVVLTVGRTSEVTQAKWSEIDEAKRIWTIPGKRMKAGKDHRVPLSAAAWAVVEQLQALRVDEWLFPGQKVGRPISDAMLTKSLGFAGAGDFTVHGLRSTFRDWVSDETQFASDIAEAALAHQVGDETERAYRRSDALAKRRKLMEAWSAYVGTVETASVLQFSRVKTDVQNS